MEIRFSRHAKRRMKLYNIPESSVSDILRNAELSSGRHEIVKKISGTELPLKILAAVENERLTVISAYPLKKGGE